ncbi:hypothetical protein ACIOWE_04975 [Pseudomonas sp. NPDC087598]|uniref:hypothetical protein n=1 Tax=Pseudomonas sp. NPDC087598 TaxID=3364440 RepID=UPI0038236973
MNDVLKEFDMLCDKSMAAFGEEFDISYEMSMVRILEFVKSSIERRELFVSRFEEVLMSNNSPFEVVAFCMRELQWPEIKEFVVSKMNPSQDPRSEALRGVLTAYDEVWPDADLYRYYDAGNDACEHLSIKVLDR